LRKAGRSVCDPTKDMLVELGNEPDRGAKGGSLKNNNYMKGGECYTMDSIIYYVFRKILKAKSALLAIGGIITILSYIY